MELHRLSVRFRIHFKILLSTFKALINRTALHYIRELINVTKHVGIIYISHTVGKMLKSFGDRSFSVAVPTRWHFQQTFIASLFTFKSYLKT